MNDGGYGTEMANKVVQRIVKLRVGEVSLVGDPANEEEFLVVKNRGGIEMTQRVKDTNAPAGVSVDQVQSADQVVTKEDAPAKDTVAAVVASPPGENAQADGASDSVSEQLDRLQKQVEQLTAAVTGPPTGEDETDKDDDEEDADKNDDGAKTDGDATIDISAMLVEIRDGIAALQTERTEKVEKSGEMAMRLKWVSERMRTATSELLGALGDLDYEMAASLMEEVKAAKGKGGGDAVSKSSTTTPATPPPAPQKTDAPAVDIERTVAAAVAKALAPVAERVAEISSAIDRVRGASSADATDSTEEPVEKSGSIWGGRILPTR